jgi:hypothetical protein
MTVGKCVGVTVTVTVTSWFHHGRSRHGCHASVIACSRVFRETNIRPEWKTTGCPKGASLVLNLIVLGRTERQDSHVHRCIAPRRFRTTTHKVVQVLVDCRTASSADLPKGSRPVECEARFRVPMTMRDANEVRQPGCGQGHGQTVLATRKSVP